MESDSFSITGFQPRKHRIIDRGVVLNGRILKRDFEVKRMAKEFKLSPDVRAYMAKCQRDYRAKKKLESQKLSK